jgi:hypothetical protein
MKPETIGLLGGIVGSAIGVLGGAVGTYFSIRNTRGPRERAFVIKASVLCWVLVSAFVAALLLLPSPQRYFLWLPYGILLPVGIRAWNRIQSKIRKEESGERA